jgi:ribosomal protein S1
VLTIGQETEVVIISVDVDRQRVSCSIKRLEDNPWQDADKKFARGTRHKLPVVRVTDRGIFLQLAEGLTGYCPARELSTDPVSRVVDFAKVGDEIEVEVKNMDRRTRRITLSAKAVVEGETRAAYKEYKKREKESGGGNATFGDALKGALGDLKLPDQKAKAAADTADDDE